MSALSTGMNLGAKVVEALPKRVQPYMWQGMQTSHLALFRATAGRVGGQLGPMRILFLHHLGAKTGAKRTSPLLYVEDGRNLAIIASKGGNPRNPAWFHNLKANPDAEVEMKGGRRLVHARVATGAERERIWKKAANVWPDYDRYQQRAPHREIPVVVLESRD